MSPETLAQETGTHARIRLRVDHFLLCMQALGCDSDVKSSRLIDVDPKTVYNARKGKAISGDFVAKTLAVFRSRAAELAGAGLIPAFDALFDVVVDAEERAA